MNKYENEYTYKSVLSPIYVTFYSFCLLFVCCTGITYCKKRNNNNLNRIRSAYSV
jgi:hypothetical protein